MQISIYWDDLTHHKRVELMKLGVYHDNIEIEPIAIIEIDDEVIKETIKEQGNDNWDFGKETERKEHGS